MSSDGKGSRKPHRAAQCPKCNDTGRVGGPMPSSRRKFGARLGSEYKDTSCPKNCRTAKLRSTPAGEAAYQAQLSERDRARKLEVEVTNAKRRAMTTLRDAERPLAILQRYADDLMRATSFRAVATLEPREYADGVSHWVTLLVPSLGGCIFRDFLVEQGDAPYPIRVADAPGHDYTIIDSENELRAFLETRRKNQGARVVLMINDALSRGR